MSSVTNFPSELRDIDVISNKSTICLQRFFITPHGTFLQHIETHVTSSSYNLSENGSRCTPQTVQAAKPEAAVLTYAPTDIMVIIVKIMMQQVIITVNHLSYEIKATHKGTKFC